MFRYIQQNPGKGYFVDLPLSHFLGEGKDYSNAFGIWDHAVGGAAPKQIELAQHRPPKADFIAVGSDVGFLVEGTSLLEYFPGYECTGTLPQLPDSQLLYARTLLPALGLIAAFRYSEATRGHDHA
jgi:hypothetical protein